MRNTTTARLIRPVIGALAVGVTAIALAGCSGGVEASGGRQSITVMNRWSDPVSLEAAEALFEGFTKETGIEVVNESLPADGDTYAPAVRSALSSSSAPDLVVFNSGPDVAAFAEGGVLKDLTGIYDSAVADRATDGATAGMLYQDDIYALSAGAAVGNLIWVNPDYLAQYDVDAASITTFEEWTDAMQTVKDAGGTPIVAGIKDQWPSGHYLNDVVQRGLGSAAAAELYSRTVAADAPDSPAWTDDAVVDGFDRYLQLAPLFQEGFAGEGADVAGSIFTSGQAGYFKMGSWFLNTILADNPDFDVDVMLFPAFEDGAGDGSEVTLANDAIMASKDADDETVEAFFEYFSRPDVAAKFGAGMNKIMPYAIDSSLSEVDPIIQTQWDKVNAFVADASAAQLFNDQSLDVNFYQKHIWQGGVGMVTGQVTPEQLAKDMEADTLALQEKNG